MDKRLKPLDIAGKLFLIFVCGVVIIRLAEGFYFDFWRLKVRPDKINLAKQSMEIGFEGADIYDFVLDYSAESDGGYLLLYQYDDPSNPDNVLLRVDLPSGNDRRIEFSYEVADIRHYGYNLQIFPKGEFAFLGLEGKSHHILYSDSLFHVLIAVIISLFLFFLHYKKKRGLITDMGYGTIWYSLFFCISIAFISVFPLLTDFISYADDMPFVIYRIEGIADAIREGQIPARINTAYWNGYGHADPIMYPNMFLYIPALMRLAGISMLRAYEYTCLFISLMTAGISYFISKKFSGSELFALSMAAVYTLSPYRLTNILLRGAFGEYISMAFLPLVLYGIYELSFSENPRSGYLIMGMTGLINSHIISVLFGCIICFVTVICGIGNYIRKKERLLYLLKAVILTALINISFIIPFLHLSKMPFYIFRQFMRLEPHAVYLSQLFASFIPCAGSSGILGNTEGESGISLGILFFFVSLLFIVIKAEIKKEGQTGIYCDLLRQGDVFLCLCIVSVVLSSVIFPWYVIASLPGPFQIFRPIQFAFRFNVFSCIFFSLLAADTMVLIYKRYFMGKIDEMIPLVVFIILVILNVAPNMDSFTYLRKTAMENKYAAYPAYGNADYWIDKADYDRYTLNRPEVGCSDGNIEISGFKRKGTRVSFSYSGAKNGDTMDIPLYYYPGYILSVNGKESPYSESPGHLIRMQLKRGSGRVEIFYKGEWFYRIGDALSLLTIVMIIVKAIMEWKRKKLG